MKLIQNSYFLFSLLILIFSFASNAELDFITSYGDDPGKKWPVRLNYIEFDVFQFKQETDIANVFAHHTLEKTKKDTFQKYKAAIDFFGILDLTYSYEKKKVLYIENDNFQLEENEFSLKETEIGLGFYLYKIRFELGRGKQDSYVFLETDTSNFNYFLMETKFTFLSLKLNIPTKYYVDLYLKLSAKVYDKSETDIYEIRKGKSREWVIGLNKKFWKFQFTPYVSYGYEDYLIVHKFFGLNNEMVIKQNLQKFGFRFTYFY